MSLNQRSYVIKLHHNNQFKSLKQNKFPFKQSICNPPSHKSKLKPIYSGNNKVHLNNKEQ